MAQCSENCTAILKMENFLALMKSISDSWMSPSSVVIAMDMTIAFLCGAGLVFLLLPSLKESPESPPPESERDMPKETEQMDEKTGRPRTTESRQLDVKRRHSKTRKKTATVKGGRGSRKYVEENQTTPQPMKISTNQLFRDSTPPPLGNPNQKMDHLPLFQLLSYLKVLEGLIQKEFSHIFWSTSSMFSEAVVATAHVLRKPSLAEHKTVRFRDTCDPAQALPQAKEPPQLPQDLPLPPELVTPCLERVSGGVQEMEMVSGSTPNQTPPCFKSRTCRRACPTAERGTQTSLPTENQPWQHGLYWKDTKGYDIQNHQAAISKPTGKLSRSTLHDRATRPASILSDHCQTAHNKEEPQNEDKATNGREQQGTPGRFLPSRKLTQLQGHFPANNDYCKSKTQLSQPAPPSILNSNICKCNKMIGSELLGGPLEKAIATCDIHNSIKKGSGLEGQDLPCTSSSSPGKAQKPRNTALRTDKLSCMNPAEHRSFLDSRTERKLAPNIPQLPRKRRKRPYLQILEARDITPPGVPASNLPQVVYPSSPICESKAEYYSKATPVLENLHHQDPGGTSVESISDARLESAASEHSLAEVQETQRMPPPAASPGASKVYPDPRQRSLDVQQPAFCFQVKPPQSGTMQETETGSLQPSSSPKMAKHAPQKRFQGVDSGQPCWRVIVIDPEEGAPPSAAKLTNTVEVKEEPPPSWRVSLGANEIHNGQAIGISPREFVFSEANKRPSHLQTPTLQHSQQSGVKPQACSMIDLISREQPQPWLVRHDPDGPSTLHHTKVSLPAEHSLSSFQNTYQPPKLSRA
ncbi:Gene model 906, (NCBI) [Apodemus speciosus]|uniref:Gene model 906, (NCBI) n=1 Tax=Apodemus speciosus TaxID=105296 RepID=A0ABQ0FG07_APOSI